MHKRASASLSTPTLHQPGFALSRPVQLRVNGQPPSGPEDSAGRVIDGDHDGQPGGNAVAVFRRGGATISAVVSNQSGKVQVIQPYAVDVLLEREDVIDLGHRARAGHSRHQLAARWA